MSGGLYVQVEVALAASPRVLRLSREAGCESAAVEGYLARLWGVWLQHQEGGGLVPLADVSDVEDMVRWCGETGRLSAALVAGGWLEEVEPGLWRVDGWSRYEDLEERQERLRAANRERQRRARERAQAHAERESRVTSRVTHALRHAEVTGPEEEEEEEEEDLGQSETTSPPPASDPRGGPSPDERALVLLEVEPAEEPIALGDWPCLPGRRGGPTTWALTEAHAAELAEAYPAVDVLAEARRARQWLRDRPRQIKTHGGMRRYVGDWMRRAQDSGGTRSPPPPQGPGGGRRETVAQRLAREAVTPRELWPGTSGPPEGDRRLEGPSRGSEDVGHSAPVWEVHRAA